MNRRLPGRPAPLRIIYKDKLTPITHPRRPGRNKPCPCSSGKKFKHCCKAVPTLIAKLTGGLVASPIDNVDTPEPVPGYEIPYNDYQL